MNKENKQSIEQDYYETGSTQPPKSRGGLVAVLLVLVILLCGATSYMGLLNIRWGLELYGDTDVPIEFYPAATASHSNTLVDELLPGVQGRTVSDPEQAFYHWPAGVVVTDILPDSQAARAGLAIGDVITGVNGRSIGGSADLQTALQDLQPGSVVSVHYCRDGGETQTFQLTWE